MNKLSKTILITTIAVFGATLLLIPSAKAASPLSVEFEDTPLFNEADFKPGDSVIRWVKVTNNSGETMPIATEAINFPGFPDLNNLPTDDLSRALLIVIREEGGSDLYGGSSSTGEKTLFDFYQDGETYLSDVGDGDTQGYEYEISFPSEKENEWQEKTTAFDIVIGFQGTEGGGGRTILGGGYLPPGLTILDESVRFVDCCETSVTILWTTSYDSTSQVVYSASGESHTLDLGAVNYGYGNSKEGDDSGIEKVVYHSVSLTGLAPETDYYYRCVSHASPPTVSLQYAFTTPPMGTCSPLPAVAGEATTGGEAAGPEEEEGMVLGEETSLGNLLATVAPFLGSANLCWLFLVLIIILICLYLLTCKKIESKKKKWLYFLGIVILVILYIYFCCTICWVWFLLALFIITLVKLLFRKKVPPQPPVMPQPPEMPGIQQ
jgi:hypothetical protein